MAETPVPDPSLEEAANQAALQAAQQGELGQDLAATAELPANRTPGSAESTNSGVAVVEEPVASETSQTPHA